MKNQTLIIAEAGVNHNGDMDMARQLIDAAAKAGADLVKFQTFSANRQVTRTAIKADYQTQTTDKKESQHEMLRRLELTAEMHKELIAHCAARNIGFFSTDCKLVGIDRHDLKRMQCPKPLADLFKPCRFHPFAAKFDVIMANFGSDY